MYRGLDYTHENPNKLQAKNSVIVKKLKFVVVQALQPYGGVQEQFMNS
jgi:hypothetical protein